jgi:hypothetical protein
MRPVEALILLSAFLTILSLFNYLLSDLARTRRVERFLILGVDLGRFFPCRVHCLPVLLEPIDEHFIVGR